MNHIEKAWHHFDYWYNWHGHWMHDNKEQAIKSWETRGINGLPDYPGERQKQFIKDQS